VEDDDEIVIDIPNRKLYAVVSDSVLENRKEKWTPPPLAVTSGCLVRYAKNVTSADKGAVLQD
jgi:dihydroxy-acid dehydratase